MMKYKNIFLSIIFLLSGMVGIFLSPQLAHAAAARCFEEEGPFLASELSSGCGAPGGSISYRDLSGATVNPQPDKCYIHHINPGTTFRVFEEANCTDMNTVTSRFYSQQCTNTGGTWEVGSAEGSGQKILNLVQDGINLFTGLAGLAITAMVIVGGIQYSSAGGNPQAAANAKKKITNAFLAMITLIFIFTFLQWLIPGGIFG